jgi:hypothetical protein
MGMLTLWMQIKKERHFAGAPFQHNFMPSNQTETKTASRERCRFSLFD